AFVVLVLLFLAGSVDALYLFCLILLGLLPLRDENCRTAGRLTVGMILLAVMSLAKFTFFLAGVALWAVVVLALGPGWRRRTALAIGYPLALAILWCLLGQSLGNFPRYLAASWEIACGYGEAMALEEAPYMGYLGVAALVFFLVLLAAHLFARPRRRENLLGLALLSISLFLVWKNGFIRQDDAHTPLFFGYLLL